MTDIDLVSPIGLYNGKAVFHSAPGMNTTSSTVAWKVSSTVRKTNVTHLALASASIPNVYPNAHKNFHGDAGIVFWYVDSSGDVIMPPYELPDGYYTPESLATTITDHINTFINEPANAPPIGTFTLHHDGIKRSFFITFQKNPARLDLTHVGFRVSSTLSALITPLPAPLPVPVQRLMVLLGLNNNNLLMNVASGLSHRINLPYPYDLCPIRNIIVRFRSGMGLDDGVVSFDSDSWGQFIIPVDAPYGSIVTYQDRMGVFNAVPTPVGYYIDNIQIELTDSYGYTLPNCGTLIEIILFVRDEISRGSKMYR